jgi:hypothetical protein
VRERGPLSPLFASLSLVSREKEKGKRKRKRRKK